MSAAGVVVLLVAIVLAACWYAAADPFPRVLSDRAVRRGQWITIHEASMVLFESLPETMDRIHAGELRSRPDRLGVWYVNAADVRAALDARLFAD